MKNVILLTISLVLFGCGSDFTSAAFVAAQGGQETGGAFVETDSSPGTGGRPGAGGSPTTGGVGTGGAPTATGGAPSTGGVVVATGGIPAAGGAPNSTGGAPIIDAGCALVTHDNGLGGAWKDCVPLGTYNEEQAMKACAAWTGDMSKCRSYSGCAGVEDVYGSNATGTEGNHWAYAGLTAGHLGVDGMCPSYGNGTRWK